MNGRRRNVLLITADQWRGDCLSSVGHPVVRSPHLDALAADGVLFERHYANAVPCGPSRACLHTGMYLHNHRSATNGTPLDRRFTNWALETRGAGYDPALFGYTHTAPDPRYMTADDPRLATDEGVLPGIRPIVDMATHCGPWREWLAGLGYPLPESHGATYGQRGDSAAQPDVPRASLYAKEHTDTYFLTQRAIEYIERASRQDAPGWIVHLSLRAPHPPWVAAAPYHARYPLRSLPGCVRHADVDTESALHPWLAEHLHSGRNASHADVKRHRLLQASYYGLMAEVDDNLGRLFARIRALGDWDDTLVIFTSDHGEQMGDHWQYGKAGFFDQSYHVPMIVRMPDGPEGGRASAFTEHVDVMPTLLEWLELDAPRQCDGRGVWQRFLRGERRRRAGAPKRIGNTTSATRNSMRARDFARERRARRRAQRRYEVRALRRVAAFAVRFGRRSGRARRSRARGSASAPACRLRAAPVVVAHEPLGQDAEPFQSDAGNGHGHTRSQEKNA